MDMEEFYSRQLQCLLGQVRKPDEIAMEASRRHWDGIAKPIAGLGEMERLITKIAGIQGTADVNIDRKAVIVFCADHGVTKEGVTQTDSSVTAIVTENFAKGIASVNRMAEVAGATVIPVDIGVAADIREPGVRNSKIAYGSANLRREPAMTMEQAMEAIHIGIGIAGEMKSAGYDLLAAGEMGIGNTTTSSAVASVLLNRPVDVMTGRGAGLTSEGLKRKIRAIEKAIEMNRPDAEDALDVLAKVGGFDLAGLAGVYLGGAYYRLPVVIDGFISAVAALAAVRLCPVSREYMLASHVSKEPGTQMILDELGMSASLTCDMCLGEGTGAVAFLPVLEMALEVYQKMSTFSENNIEDYEELGDK